MEFMRADPEDETDDTNTTEAEPSTAGDGDTAAEE